MQRTSECGRIVFAFLCFHISRWTPTALAALLFVYAGGCDTVSLFEPSAGYEAPTGDANPVGDQAQGAGTVARDIEEADIVKVVGDKLYALNRFRGLLIVDVADPDNMALLGTLDLRGRGVEMYVDSGNAYVILSADYFIPYAYGAGNSAIETVGPTPLAPDFEGSKLAVVDVSNPVAPELRTQLQLAGWASQSRRVGDILYITGSNLIPWGYEAWTDDAEDVDEGFVASISIADPTNVTAVERKTFGGTSIDIHVSQTAVFAASRKYDYDNAIGYTNIQIIDISDLGGAIAIRGSFDVPGFIGNRFYMDDYQDVFRIVTRSSGFGVSVVKLYTYDITNRDDVQPLGQVPIIQDEALEAVRFDGPRGYVVTFFVLDPLFTLDLSDPANPVVAGELEVPGYSTHIEPRGTRLIAVGIDDTNGNRPAISYYDVSDPTTPSQLGRVVLGPPGSYTQSDAVYDEKAFAIIDELGLIAIPFSHNTGLSLVMEQVDEADATARSIGVEECTKGVQLIDFNDTELIARGYFEHRGTAKRVGIIGDRLYALSEACIQSVDITDRDLPAKVSQVDFFDVAEMPYYADSCEDWYWLPDEPSGAAFTVLFDLLSGAGLCGAVGPAALAMMLVTMTMVKLGIRRRRR